MPKDVVQLTQDLVRIPSVNPMANPVSRPEIELEHRLTDYLENLFQERGLQFQRFHVEPSRDNIVAFLPGSGDKLLLLEAHQDTVPIDGMTIEPFGGAIRGDTILGRGACDVKGGMAMCLDAMFRLQDAPSPNQPSILMACTINEECGFTGAKHLANELNSHQLKFLNQMPSAAVVAEPTRMNVVIAHKGVVRWRCTTQGQATHSSNPSLGDNAIYRMGRVVELIRQYNELLQSNIDEKLGHPTVSVGTIHGGVSVNTVPDVCTIDIDRRLLPSEDPEQARQALIDFIANGIDQPAKVQHSDTYMHSPGLAASSENVQLAGQIQFACSQKEIASETLHVAFGTDAPAYAGIGIPTVIFGPGSLDQAHTKDEYIEIDQLRRATDVLETFCREFESSA